MDTNLRANLDKFVTENRENMIEDLKSLVRINSIKGEPAEGAPLGEGVKKVLAKTDELFAGSGFKTENHEIYTLAKHNFGGEDAPEIGIFAHGDVVPVDASEWDSDPFDPVEKDGCLFGRGSIDDKPGIVTALYAMRFIKEYVPEFKSRITAFTGGCEETTMADIEAFAKENDMPALSIVPDCDFPVSLGEKSIFHFWGKSDEALCDILKFEGGFAFNIVLGKAIAEVKAIDGLKEEMEKLISLGNHKDAYEIVQKGESLFIKATGIPAHAAMPDGSLNAAHLLADILAHCTKLSETDRRIMKLASELTADSYGTGLKINHTDKSFGKLTAATGMCHVNDGHLELSFDVRHGASITVSDLVADVEDLLFENRWSIDVASVAPGFEIDRNSPAANKFIEVYREFSGDKDAQPFYSSGGTYARHLNNAFSVGTRAEYIKPQIPCGGEHQSNEGICIDSFLEAFKIITAMIIEADRTLN